MSRLVASDLLVAAGEQQHQQQDRGYLCRLTTGEGGLSLGLAQPRHEQPGGDREERCVHRDPHQQARKLLVLERGQAADRRGIGGDGIEEPRRERHQRTGQPADHGGGHDHEQGETMTEAAHTRGRGDRGPEREPGAEEAERDEHPQRIVPQQVFIRPGKVPKHERAAK